MKKRILAQSLLLAVVLAGCGKSEIKENYDFDTNETEMSEIGSSEIKSLEVETSEMESFTIETFKTDVSENEVFETDIPEDLIKTSESDMLFDDFIENKIEAHEIDYNGNDHAFYFADLIDEDDEWLSYSVGDRVDLDNDGETELILNGPYGGKYLDVSDNKMSVFAEGEGTAGELRYAEFENEIWIAHCDVSHQGRQYYEFDKYEGSDNKTDSFVLSAEYYDNENDRYDENSDFSYRDQQISMEEYEHYLSMIKFG